MSYTSSILRYPGGKSRFAPFIEKALELNGLRPQLFLEPFCGGASISITLLERNAVDSIALNDSDALIASLWYVVFSGDHEWLVEQIRTVPLDLDEWRRQKALAPSNVREAALKALYLNRTSFNGIIHKAGPIGGWGQKTRTLGVRFNRTRLAERVIQLAALRHRVRDITCFDWRTFCDDFEAEEGTLFYFDPPYYHKADQLYGHHFQTDQHAEFRDFLVDFNANWVLSYDDAKEVRALYRPYEWNARVMDSTYSAHPMGGASFIGRELFFSNLRRLPAPNSADTPHEGLSVRRFCKSEPGELTRIPFFTN